MGKLLIGKVTHPLKDNLETTEPGQGSLDARQGNALRDMIDSLGLNVGDLTALQTTDKDSLVNAINNLADAVSTLNSKMSKEATILNNNWLNMNVVEVSGVKFIRCSTYPNKNMTSGTEYNIGTLPEEFRPSYKIDHATFLSGDIRGRLRITVDGAVTLVPYGDIATTQGINIHYAYV
ncbi:hypothetical protein [Frisingicoccus sp.]|uniref:hypothetical protein n=1 Tax=Frisingicoccus sp. TaxID=1918627 RepID=UPI003AB50745